MTEKKTFVLRDGNMIEADEVLLTSLSPGTVKRRGVFETLRAHNGRLFFWKEHGLRLAQGLAQLKIFSGLSTARLTRDMVGGAGALLKKNRLTSARVRWLVWRGKRDVHRAIVVLPYRPPSAAQYRNGYKVCVIKPSLPRPKFFPAIKSLDYACFLNACRDARDRGFDEGLVVDRSGKLVEGTRSNLFWVKGPTLYTPLLASGCLPGITRRHVLAIARAHGIRCRTSALAPDDLPAVSEIFLTNSLLGIMPVTQVGGRVVGRGKEGPVTMYLRKNYEIFHLPSGGLSV